MGSYEQTLREEKAYLKKTVDFIVGELEAKTSDLSDKKKKLISARRDMWENTVHFTNDFARLTEINQHLTEVNRQTASYTNTLKRLDNYKNMVDSPYFGRFDFLEDGIDNTEKIYVGLHNVINPKTHEVYIYDWRAPISGIFYRYEPGRASYDAPIGTISGEVLLKRQYKIKNSELDYFFDCSIVINDAILQEILSRNSSPKMRNIVETIQKEQDLIIRDTDNELLIVQGVAGSGKTSVALHRVAFLLYEGLNLNLRSNNVIIISPNAVFSKYISNVLPELGEENVQQTTFADIASTALVESGKPETREKQLESLISCQNPDRRKLQEQSIAFKGSGTFIRILDRLLKYFAHRMIPFEDVYFNGKVLMTAQQLKNRFLNNKTGIPMAKQLKRLENVILEKIHPLRRARLNKIELIVANSEGHELEIKQFARLLSIKEAKVFMERLHRFTRVDYRELYNLLFTDRELLFKLAQGLGLPDTIQEIISSTKENLQSEQIRYEDCAPLLYLKLRIEGSDLYPEIKQVVIDEAQDYHPLQYEIFKLLFRDAKYTVLGDVNQSIEKQAGVSIYDEISNILKKETTVKLFLNKGYRSSYEINAFTQKLLEVKQDMDSFERHDNDPVVECKQTTKLMDEAIIRDISGFFAQGYESVAVICKTRREAEIVHTRLNKSVDIGLIEPNRGDISRGAVVIPSYIAKGLEFDVVIVYGADKENYSTELDRRLLYIACTRAMHQLKIYCAGEKTPFIS